jgi:hypothetical protein
MILTVNENPATIAKLMTSGTWTHDYPITCERARALGLPVNSNMPENVLRLMELYPQPMRRQPRWSMCRFHIARIGVLRRNNDLNCRKSGRDCL